MKIVRTACQYSPTIQLILLLPLFINYYKSKKCHSVGNDVKAWMIMEYYFSKLLWKSMSTKILIEKLELLKPKLETQFISPIIGKKGLISAENQNKGLILFFGFYIV